MNFFENFFSATMTILLVIISLLIIITEWNRDERDLPVHSGATPDDVQLGVHYNTLPPTFTE